MEFGFDLLFCGLQSVRLGCSCLWILRRKVLEHFLQVNVEEDCAVLRTYALYGWLER